MTIGTVTPTSTVNSNNLVNPEGVSPDALLEYCNMQLSGLDTQMDSLMNQQESQLHEQEAVQQVQTTLEQFGSNGPQNATDMATCVSAFQTAIASLPPGDPVAGQLQTQCTSMESTYGYTAGQSLSSSQQSQLSDAQAIVAKGPPDLMTDPAGYMQYQAAQLTVSSLNGVENGSLGKAPANNQWQGTTDALGNLASDIKSNAEIQMLQLQDLVSQRQQVTEMTTQMMTTEDNTLLDQAKAIGA
jgi:uncharacterized protein YgfB (UPF0149 family)